MMRNVLSKQHSAAVCYINIVLFCAEGAGFLLASMRYHAAWVAASADAMSGI